MTAAQRLWAIVAGSPVSWALLAVLGVQLADLAFGSKAVPFTSDSADYIEQARALAQGAAPTRTAWGLEGPLVGPSTSFPVGYPLLIAPLVALGVPAADAALAVSRGSMLLVPVIVAWAFAGLLGPWAAAAAVALIGLMPGLLGSGELAMSDAPALALSLAGIGLLLRPPTPARWLWSGVMIAGAYAVRNAQLSLLLVVGLFAALLAVRSAQTHRRVAVAWFVGAALVVVPLLLRNLWVFGRLQPYDMPPSTVGLVFNVRVFAAAALQDLFGYVELAHAIAWTPWGFVLLSLGLAVGGGYGLRFALADSDVSARRAVVLLGIAAAFGAFVVIAARTRYQWGGHISVRNTFPVVALAVLALLVLFRQRFDGPRRWRALGPAVLVAGLVTHSHAAVRDWTAGSPRDALELHARASTSKAFCSRAAQPGEVFISNWAFLARIDCAQPVRHLELVNAASDAGARDQSSKQWHDQTLAERLDALPSMLPGQALRVAVVPGTLGVTDADLPLQADVVDRLQQQGWRIEAHDPTGLVMARAAAPVAAGLQAWPAFGQDTRQAPGR